jgi:hypothetical protein
MTPSTDTRVSAGFTPGPWTTHCSHIYAPDGAILAVVHNPGSKASDYPLVANRDLMAAAPELFEAAAKHLEWIEKEHAGPQYGDLTRDTHPLGEAIWQQWWNEQLELCAATEGLCRAALTKARGQ